MNRSELHSVPYSHPILCERYERIDHPSGLTVYLFPKRFRTAYVLFATSFGSSDSEFVLEGRHIALPGGTAHFLEHKMFEKENGEDAFTVFSALGVDANAYTAWDHTAYLFSATSNFEPALRELLSFVTTPHFTKASVEKEQGIIREEIAMNDDSPSERCFMNLLKALYRENPIRKEICGSESSIAEITPEVLYTAHRAFYRPSNMTLVVVGDIKKETLLRIVDAHYGDLVDSAPPPTRISKGREPLSVSAPRIEERMEVGKPLFLIGMKDEPALSLCREARMRRSAAMAIIKEALFSPSSEFYNRLLDENQISQNLSAGYGATPRYAFFEISGESYEPDRILSEVQKTLRSAAKQGMDRDAFLRSKRVLYAKAVKSFDSTQSIGELLLDYVISDSELFSYIDCLAAVTEEEVHEILASAFPDSAFALSVISPFSGDPLSQ